MNAAAESGAHRRWLRDPGGELRSTREAAMARPTAAMAGGGILRLRRADSLLVSPTKWLINDFLPRNALVGLVGPSGACKSFLAIDWACCVAAGMDWKGHGVQMSPVCFLAGEGNQGLRKRVAAWEKANAVSIVEKALYFSEELPSLCDPDNVERCIEEMMTLSVSGPGLIVIDTVARALGGANENSSEDMGKLVAAMDRMRTQCLDATVLSIHHTGHDQATQHRARGSSAYRASLDCEFLVKTDGTCIDLTASKSKDWDEPSTVRLRKQAVDVDVGGIAEASLVLSLAASQRVDIASEAMPLRAAGKTVREIAEYLGESKSKVGRILKSASVECPVPPV